MTEQQMLSVARQACEAGRRAGADFVEVRISEGKSANVRLERSSVDSTEVKLISGAGVRAFCKGGLGSVSLDGLDVTRIIQAAEQAAEMARFAVPDKDFMTLPAPEDEISVAGLYDPAIENIDTPALARIALECVEAAKSIAPDAICTGAAGVGYGWTALANSLGLARTSRSSSISTWIEPIIRQGDDVGAFYDYDAARMMTDFDHRGIGVSAAEAALKFLGARKIESRVMPVVLGPLCSSSLFESLAGSAEAESHQRGRSWLCGKLGEKIASRNVSLIDDATIPGGLGSRACDSEGVTSRKLPVVVDGVLVNLLHNSYTANKADADYTGHAHKGGIRPTNVIPKLGDVTSEEIIKDTPLGLYLNMGSISPDSTTGDVSATVDFGFLIENGELTHAVAGAMIGGNGFELLNGIDVVSSDARIEPGAVMPTIRIQGVRVAGGK